MEIRFRKVKLKKQYDDYRQAEKAYGVQVGRRYIQRINIVKNSASINDLIKIEALSCHRLKGDRKGQWALKLTGFYRLIFTLVGDTLEIVQIEEVSKHYDD